MMKKTVLGITMMVLSAFGLTAMAQNNNCAQNCGNQSAACNVACSNCPDCKECPGKANCKECPGKANCKECPGKANCKECPGKANCKECPGKAVCTAAGNCPADSAVCCKGARRSRCVAAGKNGAHKFNRAAVSAFNHKGGGKLNRDLKGDRKFDVRTNLFEGIELTADQQSRINDLDSKMAAERKAAREVAKEKKAEVKSDMSKSREEIRATYEKELKSILTEEQYAKYQLNQKNMQARKASLGDARKMKADLRTGTPVKEADKKTASK